MINTKDMAQNQGEMSSDTKTLITVLLLIFAYPVGVILVFVWMKWPTWVKILICLPILIVILAILFALLAIAISPKDIQERTKQVEQKQQQLQQIPSSTLAPKTQNTR